MEASSVFACCARRREGGYGEEAAPVAEPGAGGEAGAAQEDRRRHPPPGNIQAGTRAPGPSRIPHPVPVFATAGWSRLVDCVSVNFVCGMLYHGIGQNFPHRDLPN